MRYNVKTVRTAVFETNSSSEHSVTLTDADTFHKWTLDEVLFNVESEEFKTVQEIFAELRADDDAKDLHVVDYSEFSLFVTYSGTVRVFACEDEPVDTVYNGLIRCEHLTPEILKNLWWWMHNNSYITFDDYKNDDELEFWSEMAPVQGVEVVAFGKYGCC